VRPTRRAGAVVIRSLVVAAALLAAVGPARANAQDEDGKALFDRFCAGCHTVGGGDGAGPDLEGLADRRERAWVEAFIRDPAAVIDSGDPTAVELREAFGTVMPALGVSDAQLAALVVYLGFDQAPEETPTDTTPAETPSLPAGDADRGKRLFEGSDRFDGGGPACLSCHSLAGVGALGGGQLGPDLTDAADRLGGEQGLAGWLAGVPSPTMAPIFEGRPLTAEERADLGAFIASAASTERDSGQALKLVALAVGVALLVAVLASAVWQRRLGGVRRPLVDRATGRST